MKPTAPFAAALLALACAACSRRITRFRPSETACRRTRLTAATAFQPKGI